VASPLFNFSGLASGLDTNSIVSSLMQVERAPITRLQIRRAEYDNKLDAWTSITSKVSEFRNATDELSNGADFAKFVSASSSNEDAVVATITGTPLPAAVSMTVVQLAATHQIASGSGMSSSDDLVGTGTFSVTTSTGTTNLSTDASTTLASLAQSINSADLGVAASIIQVTDTDLRLLMTADQSGLDDTFSVTSDLTAFSTSEEISTGQDATLRIGDPVTGLDVTRPTNVFTNAIEGVSLDLKTAGTGPVTIAIARDTAQAAAAVTSMVEAANGVLDEISSQTSYNAESDRASPLTNDSAARDIAFGLQSLLSGTVASTGDIRHLGDLGVDFTRSGNYTIDETKLTEALEANFDEVIDLFIRGGSDADPRVTYLGATGETVDGSYEVIVTAAPDGPSIVGDPYVASPQFEDLNIRYGTENALIGIGAGSSIADAITQINDGLAIFGLDEVLADNFGGAIRLTTPGRFGSAIDMAVWNDEAFGLNAIAAGIDVAGTIGGEIATGVGTTLTAAAGNPTGLSVLVTATPADVGGGPLSLGDVGISQGLSGGADAWLDRIEGVDGAISRARGEWDTRIEVIDDDIAAFEIRMSLREQQLRREFTAMETALAQLQNQSQFLSGFLAPQQQQQ